MKIVEIFYGINQKYNVLTDLNEDLEAAQKVNTIYDNVFRFCDDS